MSPAWLRDLPVAHRGLHGPGIPENSLAAFEAAVAAGFAIELDARVSADGEPMVFHDETLDRMTGVTGRVDRHDAATLRLFGLGGGERIPTLADALALVAGRTPVLVEVKPGRMIERCCARVMSDYRGALAVQSFDPLSVRRLARLVPAPAGLLAASSDRLLLAHALRPDFLAHDVRSPSVGRAGRAAAALGVPLLLWTVRSAREHAIADRLGANRIFERAAA